MTAQLIVGSAAHEIRQLPPGSVDLVVTSSPFLAVRNYLPDDHPMKQYELGLGGTPSSFVADLLEITDGCAQALAPHGTMVWELGDSMAGSGGAGGDYYNDDGQRAGQPKPLGAARAATKGRARSGHPVPAHATRPGVAAARDRRQDPASSRRPAAPPMRSNGEGWPLEKGHALVPELFRLALAYGEQPYTGQTCEQWIVRNVLRWCKPNPSVGDEGDKYRRATTDLVVAALAGDRYWDPIGARGPSRSTPGATAPLYDWWDLPTGNYRGAHFATWPTGLVQPLIASMCPHRVCTVCGKPSVRITQATAEYVATRPAGDRFAQLHGENDKGTGRNGTVDLRQQRGEGGSTSLVSAQYEHVGWTWCGHGGEPHRLVNLASKREWIDAGKPEWLPVMIGATRVGYAHDTTEIHGGDNSSGRRGVVLDPFAGSGTTLDAAVTMGRDAIGIELLDDHAALAAQRLGMFVEIHHGTAHQVPA